MEKDGLKEQRISIENLKKEKEGDHLMDRKNTLATEKLKGGKTEERVSERLITRNYFNWKLKHRE